MLEGVVPPFPTYHSGLRVIQEFEGASTSYSVSEVIKLKEELTYGLKELRSSHIPDNWI
jgi:hypothetical protein